MSSLNRKAITQAERAGGRRWCLGDAYEPLHHVQDVMKSNGERARFPYQGRIMHLLSRLEQRAFWHFCWDPSVTGIEEQYYLELDVTTRIANEAGASHPLMRPRQDEPFPMSTDLVVYHHTSTGPARIARQIKYSKAFELGEVDDRDRRKAEHVIEKLEIERRYWAEQNVDWQVLTERELSAARAENIRHCLAVELDPRRPHGFWTDAIERVRDAIAGGDGLLLVHLAQRLDEQGVLDHADFGICVRHMVKTRQLEFDMNEPYDQMRPASDFHFVEHPARLAA